MTLQPLIVSIARTLVAEAPTPMSSGSPAGPSRQHTRERVRSSPGFIAGYWLEPADGQGFSIVLFETEEQARETTPPLSSWEAPGVTIGGVEFRRVAATA
jgi:hypothetical protein